MVSIRAPRHFSGRRYFGALIVTWALLTSLPATAQSYTVLHPFSYAQQNPGGLVQASDGSFYGTTNSGGTNGYGSVFKITPTGTLTTLFSFSGSDGQNPQGTLIQGTDGNLYGTTSQGGANGWGTVFRMTLAGALTTLHSFEGSDGQNPYAGLVQGTDGDFYGTTSSGGASDVGTVFKITTVGALTTLYSFAGSDGAYPQARLVQGTDGNLYGTTSQGGAGGNGTVFKITTAGAFANLHSFAGGEGQNPYAGLVQATDGNLYGTTSSGGTNSNGTVFRITTAGVLTTLHSFAFLADGAFPYAGLLHGTDGNLYGTTSQGGAGGNGTVFKITTAGALTTLYSFAWSVGASPTADLAQGSDGDFYGTTSQGGATGNGTVFKITPAGALTTLHSFAGSDGESPYAGLVQGTDGNFYGTTIYGGTSSIGTVFKITPAGALTTLHSFAGSDGANPQASLVQGTDGNFYGTTYQGGTSDFGTVFKITPAGALTTLHSFAGSDGAYPSAGLVQGTDGNFYGTTYQGGTSDFGTVFKITTAGVFTILHSFAGSEGQNPYAGLVQGTDGNFYGTTSSGGASGLGTVFKITPAGVLTTLRSFAGSDGSSPYAGLVQGTDGNFYGTTNQGGANGYGSVFKITPAGALTTIYSFEDSDGSYPQAGLVRGTDGNFYGTTTSGGASSNGTVFTITPAGALTTLHSFTFNDGSTPYAAVVQGADGYFYGTTTSGGPRLGGVVFRLTPGPGPSPTVTGVVPSSGPAWGGTVVTISGTDFQPGATVTIGDTAAVGVTYSSATTVYALTPVHAAGAVTVTVTNPDLQEGSLASAYTYTCSWTTTAFNGGPYCNGATISLSTPTVSGADYFWTGPNGFSSTLQNPTIPNATVANAGIYGVTATVGGCASAAANTSVVVSPATPLITAPTSAPPGATGLVASVPFHAGSSYLWGITNGTITAGATTSQITFTAGTSGVTILTNVETTSTGCVSATATEYVNINVQPAGFVEDAHASGGTISNVNNILDPGETVLVNPSWKNVSASPLTLTGTASAFTGPAGATYTLLDTAANYGTIAPGATSDSFTAGGPSYRLSVSNPAIRPAAHWDATFLETLSTGGMNSWTVHVGNSFTDVPTSDVWSYPFVETLFHNGITIGCAPGIYCPYDLTPRWQMAVFLARGLLGPGVPIPTTGTVPASYNCSAGGNSLFTDVAPTDVGCPGIHYIYSQQVTVGCAPGIFCPNDMTPRWQMAVFLARVLLGPGVPIPTTGTIPATYDCSAGGNSLFTDVAPTDVGCPGIHYIYSQQVTVGCGPGIFCPDGLTSRWEMAIFLVRAFHLSFLH